MMRNLAYDYQLAVRQFENELAAIDRKFARMLTEGPLDAGRRDVVFVAWGASRHRLVKLFGLK